MPERYVGRELGRFRIDSVIGSGGFAWVYKGYDPELDIPVAIKVLKPQYAGDPAFEARFRREASTAAKLRHPNIVRILAVGRQDDAVYFVMDYLPTGLDDRLRIMGTLPESLLIRLGMDVSAALAFAHREGVIHRDIKTDNILFDEHGNAIVADFGIARAVSGYTAQTGTNMVVGTPQYFSPEQARGQPLDGRADIYSLGVTLFKAATGVLPFQGDDWYDIARQHVEEPPPKPRSFNPALSRGIERIILKCLEKDPADRYQTGDALHAELMQLLGRTASPDNDATVVMPTPVGPQGTVVITSGAARAPRRPGGRTVLTAGAAAALVVALVASAVRTHRTAAHEPRTPAESVPNPSLATDSRDSTPAATLADSAVLAGAAGDTLQSGASARPTTTAPAGAVGRELLVTAPGDAEVWVDGKRKGTGGWYTDRIAPGEHRIVAALSSIQRCPSARVDTTVLVRESGSMTITLSPRPCGYLVLDALPTGARWMVSAPSGTTVMQGTVPQTKPVILPAGTYTLRVSAPYCADYLADFTVTAAETHRERVRLICA